MINLNKKVQVSAGCEWWCDVTWLDEQPQGDHHGQHRLGFVVTKNGLRQAVKVGASRATITGYGMTDLVRNTPKTWHFCMYRNNLLSADDEPMLSRKYKSREGMRSELNRYGHTLLEEYTHTEAE